MLIVDRPKILLILATQLRSALLPKDCCPDVHERLILYKLLANSTNKDNLDILQEELIDYFDLLPEQGNTLI